MMLVLLVKLSPKWMSSSKTFILGDPENTSFFKNAIQYRPWNIHASSFGHASNNS